MKLIPLRCSELAAMVDDDDYDWLMQYKWSFRPAPGGRGYAVTFINLKAVPMHRIVLDIVGQDWKQAQVDHVNGDGLDNRRSNIRVANSAQNQANKSKYRNNSSGFKGVFYVADSKKWKSTMSINRERFHLGVYDSAEEAARVYDVWAIHFYGEFAKTNGLEDRPLP